MGKSRTRSHGAAPAPAFVASGSSWLRQILAFAELEEHFKAAVPWADQTGCIQKDLSNEECLQELIDHLALKKFPAMRLRNARDVFASALTTKVGEEDVYSVSTAASIIETNTLMSEEAVCALSEFPV